MYHQFIQSSQQQTWLEVVKGLAVQCQAKAAETDCLGVFQQLAQRSFAQYEE